MQKIKVQSREDVIKLVERALVDASVIEEADIQISPELARLTLHLDGDYEATITPAMMRSLLYIQDALYGIYSLGQYGYKKRLSAEEREAVEFAANVKPGTTTIEVLLDKALGAISKMTGGQALKAVGILSAACLIGTLGTKTMDYHVKLAEIQQRAEETEGYQQLAAASISLALEGQRDFYRAIAKEPYQALEVNGSVLSHDELRTMIKSPRQVKEELDEIYRGEFKITRIYIEDEGTFIDATHISSNTPISYINILKDYISQGDYQWIKDAVRDGTGQPIHMTVVAHIKGGVIQSSILQSIGEGSSGK